MYYEQVVLNRFSPEIPLCSGRIDRSQSYVAPPPPHSSGIKRVRDCVDDLARASKSFTEIKKNRGSCLRGPELDTELLSRQGACHLLLKKNVRTALFIVSVAATVADERGLTPGLFLLRMEYRICS
jgi:hypothetical protein